MDKADTPVEDEEFDELAYFGYTSELLDHRDLLRQALERHREGDDDDGTHDEFELDEKVVYPGLDALNARRPPPVVQGPSGWIYMSTSFGCLRPYSCLRWMAIHIVEAPWFDPFILLTIMVNCSTMAWASPLDPPGTKKEEILAYMEWVYLYIFTFELSMKMLAYGIICHRNSYLRDAWCQLDFVVVSLAWLPILFPQFGNMSAIRSVRALRPLRALKRVPGMPVLVGSILQSLPALGNVGMMSAFLFGIFGIVGMNLFGGLLHYRCADPAIFDSDDYSRWLARNAEDEEERRRALLAAEPAATGALASLAAALAGVWAGAGQSAIGEGDSMQRRLWRSGRALKGGATDVVSSHWQADYDSGTFCAMTKDAEPGSAGDMCAADGQVCFFFTENPDGGTVSFDSVAAGMLPILQAVTFDTWTGPMFYIMDSYSYYVGSLFFLAVAVFGGLFVVNLFLAVIFDEFMRAQASEEAEQELAAAIGDGDGGFDVVDIETEAALIKAGRLQSDGTPKAAGNGGGKAAAAAAGGGCCDCEARKSGWRRNLKDCMNSACMGNLSTGFVVFNLIVMCMPYAGQPAEWEQFVESLAEFVTWVFIVEMYLKLIGMGCASYWADSWNVLDGVIVSLSIVEMLITILLADTGVNISFLRMLRLLRLLRLLKAWPGLYKIVMAFVKSIPQMTNLFVLMTLLMFICALLGMQTFGGTGVSEDSRWHFDSVYPAMLAVFGIYTGGWVDSFQVCSDKVGVGTSTLYFVPTLFIGFFVIMNLFIAILLEAFAGDDDEGDDAGKEGGDGGVTPREDRAVKAGDDEEGGAEGGGNDGELEGMSLGCLAPENGLRRFCLWLSAHSAFDSFIILLIIASSVCLALDVPRLDPGSELKSYLDLLNYWFTGLFILEMTLKIVAYGFVFNGERSYLRQPWNILDFLIVGISILGLLAHLVPAFGQLKSLRILRVLRPLRLLQRSPGMKIIIVSLIKTLPSVVEVTAVVGVLHIVFSIIGMQLFSGKFGSCTDESITTRALCYPPGELPPVSATSVSYAAVATAVTPAAAIAPPPPPLAGAALPAEAARMRRRLGSDGADAADLDTLAPPPLVAGRALASSAPPLVALEETGGEETGGEETGGKEMGGAELQPRAAVETEAERQARLARGRALYAAQKQVAARRLGASSARRRGRQLKGGGGDGGEPLPVAWLNPPFGSFDDFAQSMLILYIASTTDGWEEFMFMGMDAQEEGVAPERNDTSAASVFFLMWMIVGSFISLNLFVGAIVDNFTKIKQQSDGSATMTPEQQQWADALKQTYQNQAVKTPKPPTWRPRRRAFRLVQSQPFEYGVMTVIVLNVLGMSLDHYGNNPEDEPEFNFYYRNGMLFFTYFYYCEALLKIFALGTNYFADGWCRFDLFLVVVSLMDQFFMELLLEILPMPPTVLRVLRVARVLRVLRLLRNLKGLRDLVFTLVLAFPSLINVGCLLGIVMFMYAVLGLNLFTFVMHGGDLDDDRNFESFGNAMLTLFQCLTGDGWSAVMNDLRVDEARGCDPTLVPSNCGTSLALPYFISWTVIGSFVFLNLIVAVILEHFTALGNVNPNLVSAADIADFKEAWGKFDPDADGRIPAKDLPALVNQLPPPIGIKGTDTGDIR